MMRRNLVLVLGLKGLKEAGHMGLPTQKKNENLAIIWV